MSFFLVLVLVFVALAGCTANCVGPRWIYCAIACPTSRLVPYWVPKSKYWTPERNATSTHRVTCSWGVLYNEYPTRGIRKEDDDDNDNSGDRGLAFRGEVTLLSRADADALFGTIMPALDCTVVVAAAVPTPAVVMRTSRRESRFDDEVVDGVDAGGLDNGALRPYTNVRLLLLPVIVVGGGGGCCCSTKRAVSPLRSPHRRISSSITTTTTDTTPIRHHHRDVEEGDTNATDESTTILLSNRFSSVVPRRVSLRCEVWFFLFGSFSFFFLLSSDAGLRVSDRIKYSCW